MSSLVVLPLAVVANGGSVKYSAQLIGLLLEVCGGRESESDTWPGLMDQRMLCRLKEQSVSILGMND